MAVVELNEIAYLKSIWASLTRIEELTQMPRMELPEPPDNSLLIQAIAELKQAVLEMNLPTPQVTVKGEPSNLTADLYKLLRDGQSANQVILDQIKEAIKSQITAEKQPARIMAGGPKTVKIETPEGIVTDFPDRNRYGPELRTTKAFTVNSIGDNTLLTPTIGKKLRVFWVGLSTSQNNSGENRVSVLFQGDANPRIVWNLGNPGAFSHWEPLDGTINAPFLLNLSTTDPVQANLTYQEVS